MTPQPGEVWINSTAETARPFLITKVRFEWVEAVIISGEDSAGFATTIYYTKDFDKKFKRVWPQ